MGAYLKEDPQRPMDTSRLQTARHSVVDVPLGLDNIRLIRHARLVGRLVSLVLCSRGGELQRGHRLNPPVRFDVQRLLARTPLFS